MQERGNVLRIFEETKRAVETNDTFKLTQLSDQTNNTASRTQDPDNITTAVIIYSIGKILEREEYRNESGWNKFYKKILVYLDRIISNLKEKNDMEAGESLKLMRGEIENLSGKLKDYIHDVFRKAQINKASKIYEHVISLEKTAKLLGITMFDLAGYAGQKISESRGGKELSEKQRIKWAMEMFE